MIARESVLAVKETERTTERVSTDTDVRALADRKNHAPADEELAVHFAECRAGVYGERAHVGVPRDVRHLRQVEDYAYVGIRDEVFEAVSAAADGDAQFVAHGGLYRVDDVGYGAGETKVIWLCIEPLVESAA